MVIRNTTLLHASATVLALGLVACGAAVPSEGAHDVPTPAGEPRAVLHVLVTLPPKSGCEEEFALSLYEHTGVDVIAWDATGIGCRGRHARIKYLPNRISRGELEERVRELSVSVEVVER